MKDIWGCLKIHPKKNNLIYWCSSHFMVSISHGSGYLMVLVLVVSFSEKAIGILVSHLSLSGWPLQHLQAGMAF